jgi:hypothetical protein
MTGYGGQSTGFSDRKRRRGMPYRSFIIVKPMRVSFNKMMDKKLSRWAKMFIGLGKKYFYQQRCLTIGGKARYHRQGAK